MTAPAAILTGQPCMGCKAPAPLHAARIGWRPWPVVSAPTCKCPVCWIPNPKQAIFLGLTCEEGGFGGSGGGGKTDALILDAIWPILQGKGYGRQYRALLLRRTLEDLRKWLEPRTREIYPRLGGEYNENKRTWTFPGGEIVALGGAEHEREIEKFKGSPWQYVGFDELDMFTEYQYTFMFSRLRSAHGIPCFLRSSTNPPDASGKWIRRRFWPWLGKPRDERQSDDDGLPFAGPGEVLHFAKNREGVESLVEPGTPFAVGRTFVRSHLHDNPALAFDGAYERGLWQLDRVTRARILDGDFDAEDAPGELFQRPWFEIVDACPAEVIRCRAWDLAATRPNPQNPDPDWTRGPKLALSREGIYYVEDVVGCRDTPLKVEQLITQTAVLDGKEVAIELPLDPAQAGKFQIASLVTALAGFNVHARKITGDKLIRARPWSAQAEARNIKLVRGPWNADFLREVERFPKTGIHDDQVDGVSLAFEQLTLAAHRIRWVKRSQPAA